MHQVIEGVVYPDGWHYMQLWKGALVRIDSDSYVNLLVAVQTWRVQNGCDVGNFKADVDAQLCTNHPRNCHGNPRAEGGVDTTPSRSQTFVDQLVAWGRKMINSSVSKSHVTNEVAAARAQICLRCPRHIRWENSCGTCVGAAEQLFTLARSMRDVPSVGKNLKACSSFKINCRTAVWLKKEAFAGQPSVDVPHECWITK